MWSPRSLSGPDLNNRLKHSEKLRIKKIFGEKEQRIIVLFKVQMYVSLSDEGIFGLCLTIS